MSTINTVVTMVQKVWCLILLCCVLGVVLAKNMEVTLTTKWPQTSLLAESAEYLSKDKPVSFWDIVDNIPGSTGRFTQYQAYKVAMDYVGEFRQKEGALMEMSLAT
eukprot:gene22048-1286_t